MEAKKINPQYLFDSKGNKSFVILSFEEYKGLLEDIHDLGIIAERRDEPKISFKEFEKKLKADGLLSD